MFQLLQTSTEYILKEMLTMGEDGDREFVETSLVNHQ